MLEKEEIIEQLTTKKKITSFESLIVKRYPDMTIKEHPTVQGALQMLCFFPNGYGVSIVKGETFYTDSDHPYELAVLSGTEKGWELTYDTKITSDVVGYLEQEDINRLLKEIQDLPPHNKK